MRKLIGDLTPVVLFFGLVAVATAWLVAREAILVMAPLVVFALGGALIFVTLVAAAVFAFNRVDSLLTRHAKKRRDRVLADNEARQSDLALARDRMHYDFEQVMLGGQARQILDGLIYGSRFGEATFASHAAAVARLAASNDGVPALAEPMKPLLPLMVNAERLLFVGGMKSGKTTNLLWLAHERQKMGRVIVIDSHATPAKWPPGCQVIGAKRNYRTIESLLKWLVKEMDRRFADMAEGIVGERGHEIITVISDEWTLLPDAIPNVKEYAKPLLTESRKAALDFFLAAHDHTCEALGLQGVSGLKKGFDAIIFCERHLDTEAHETKVAFNFKEKDAVPYEPPGPFIIQGTSSPVKNDGTPLLGEPVGDVWDIGQEDEGPEPEPTPREKIILELFDEGASFNQISKTINEGRTGGTYNDEIKSTLAKFDKIQL